LIAGWMLLRHPAGGLIGLLVGHAFDADWFKSPADNPYRVFGLAEDASDAELDLAYRRLISQYHPDRLAGAAPELQRQAEAKAREINTAYDRIKELRRK
jgi:curved DNA-binding protein CbpA